MKFKIKFRQVNHDYDFHVKLIATDRKKESWRVWNDEIDIEIESNRPVSKGSLPVWVITKGEVIPASLIYNITGEINDHVQKVKNK